MHNGRGRAGVYAGIAAVAVTAALGFGGAAGADEAADAVVYARENAAGTVFCFTTDPASVCAAGEVGDVQIAVGEKVTWTWTASSQPHNVAEGSTPPAWKYPASGFVQTGTYERTFDQAGTFRYFCQAHPQMEGTITVGTPTPTPTPTPTQAPPASPPPTDTTPAPGGGDDTVKPTVSRVRAKALRRAVRVRFRLSEPATVTVRVLRRGSRRVLKSARVQAGAGARTLTLRSRRLKAGRYTIKIEARDAFGNRSRVATERLTIRR